MRRRGFMLDDAWVTMLGWLLGLAAVLMVGLVVWIIFRGPETWAPKSLTVVCADGYRYLMSNPSRYSVELVQMLEEAPGGGLRPLRCSPDAADSVAQPVRVSVVPVQNMMEER